MFRDTYVWHVILFLIPIYLYFFQFYFIFKLILILNSWFIYTYGYLNGISLMEKLWIIKTKLKGIFYFNSDCYGLNLSDHSAFVTLPLSPLPSDSHAHIWFHLLECGWDLWLSSNQLNVANLMTHHSHDFAMVYKASSY